MQGRHTQIKNWPYEAIKGRLCYRITLESYITPRYLTYDSTEIWRIFSQTLSRYRLLRGFLKTLKTLSVFYIRVYIYVYIISICISNLKNYVLNVAAAKWFFYALSSVLFFLNRKVNFTTVYEGFFNTVWCLLNLFFFS